ncbi:MAG: AAA family ATPase, partial [Gemmataceae bacterium]|nr:AAA family ATPase [Gemmataceae bacterium]
MSSSPQVRIFVSSPGDVGPERLIVARVLQRLQGEFFSRLRLEPIFWEHEPVRATADYQSQFPLASSCDIVVCILWSRLGTRLPDKFAKPDGSPYASGTEFEFEDAANAHRKRGLPDLLVYRKTAAPLADLSDEGKLRQQLNQKKSLDSFLERWFGSPDQGFSAGFSTFAGAADFERQVETHLRKLLEKRLPPGVAPAEDLVATAWHQGSPFRGLQPFGPEHASIFFGRTQAIAAVRETLVRQASKGRAFVLVLGASGSGKSSLLRAGVLPTLTTPGVVEGVGLWRYAIFRPGDASTNPCEALAAALRNPAALPELGEQGYEEDQLLRLMREAPQMLDQPVQAALRLAASRNAEVEKLTAPPLARLLIVADQFEQLFTIPQFRSEDRVQFVRALSALAKSGSVWIAAAMRSDFYHGCADIPDLLPLKDDGGQIDLLPPSLEELRQLIVLPARAAGLLFEHPDHGERLDATLQEAAARHPGSLPLLKFTLEELYRSALRKGTNILALTDYRELGGLEGSLARRAEDAVTRLPEATLAAFAQVMPTLVAVSASEGRTAATPVRLDHFAKDSAARALIDALVDHRLMVTDALPDGTPTGRLAHDALLTHWPRLRQWVADNDELLRTLGRVTGAHQRWQDAQRNLDYLLSEGRPLAEAEDLLLKHAESIDPAVATCVRTSADHVRRRRQSRRRVIGTAVGTFLAVVSAISVYSWAGWIAAATESAKATTAEAKAEKNLDQAIRTADELVTKTLREIKPLAGAQIETVSKYLVDAVTVFDGFLEKKRDDPVLARKAALLSEIAGVYQAMADVERAEDYCRRADEIYRKLIPSERSFELRAGNNRLLLCLILGEQHRVEEALDLAKGCLAIAQVAVHSVRLILGKLAQLGRGRLHMLSA